jgi:large subunit ribosomal protein L18
MARGPTYHVPPRRRRSARTDYRKRLALITSRRARLVARFSGRNIYAQIVRSTRLGDETLACSNSKEIMRRYGWRGHPANTPAAYLVGMLAGYKSVKSGVGDAILDIGLSTPAKGARVFAVAKGAIDAGLHIACDASMLPPEERVRGAHIAEFAKALSTSSPDSYNKFFSSYLAKGQRPEGLPEHFIEVEGRIREDFAK